MKKTLIFIIAIMLVIVLSFSLFACNKDKGNENKDNGNTADDSGTKPSGGNGGTTAGKQLSWEELGTNEAVTTQLLTYADQYLTNNATSTKDISTTLQSALQSQANALEGKPIDKVAVKLDTDGCYTVTFTYKNKDTFTYHVEGELEARVAEPGVYAGYAIAKDMEKVDFDTSLAVVYNAFLRTMQQAIEEAGEFGEDYMASAIAGEADKGYTFGGSVEAAFMFNYGAGDSQIGPMSYGLRVYGTLGYDAADTEVAIEVIDEQAGDVVVGLYYKDAVLFLSIDAGDYEQKYYLDDADINAIVGAMLGDIWANECEHDYVDGYCTLCGKVEPEESDAEPFYEHAPNYTKLSDALSDLTGGNSMVGTVVKIVAPLLDSRQVAVGSNTRYIYQIDLDALIKKLLGNSVLGPMIAGAVNPVIESILPELDLGSFQGVGGTLTLSFDVTGGKSATLAGAQVAYNVAQKDFRWNKNDTEAKLYGPVNAAITVSDFAIGDQTVESAKVNTSKYTYFSPMNGEITADVSYVDEADPLSDLNGEYKLIARAEFNPFTLFAGDDTREGAAEIILDKANGDPFFQVYIHDFTCIEGAWDSTVTVYYDGEYYETLASQSDFFSNVFEDFILPLVSRDTESNLKPISDYVWELIDQFSKDYTADEFQADVADYVAEINALAVTKHDIEVKADGTEVDHGVMDSSKFLDAIKTNALDAIRAASSEVADTSDARKAAKEQIAKIVSQAKSDYSAQLKLEGKDESIFDGFNIMSLVSNFSALKGLFIGDDGSAANPNWFDYKLDLSDPQLHANLDYKAYNAVIDILKLALPKFEDLSRDAATVKVEMNTEGYKDKMWVNVVYGDYEVDVLVDITGCIADGRLASKCTMTADIKVLGPTNYIYAVTADLNNWDKDGGTITLSFKESDGARVNKATDEFVKMVITQDWKGEEYVGFDVELKLVTRKADGSGFNEAHLYNISGKHVDGMYVLSIEECGITLGIGNFDGGFDKDNELSFGIPAPWCNFSFSANMGAKDVKIDVTDLKLSKWGAEMTGASAIRGIDTTDQVVIRNTSDSKAMDKALFDVVEDLFGGFFYEPVE